MNETCKNKIADHLLNEFAREIKDRTGLTFEERNSYILGQGILARLNQTGIEDPHEYLSYIRSLSERHEEYELLVSEITINETSFFRHKSHFDALKYRIIPYIIKLNRNTKKRMRIWSAGCSSGEEPYSIAILVRESLHDFQLQDIDIFASDIDKRALTMAKEAVYIKRRLRYMNKSLIKRYFTLVDGRYHLVDDVKKMVKFHHINLVEPHKSILSRTIQDFDIIYCKNVLIYFDVQTQNKVIEFLYKNLSHEGFLFLGHSETLQYMDVPLILDRYENTFFYRKTAQGKGKKILCNNSAILSSTRDRKDSGRNKDSLPRPKHASSVAATTDRITYGGSEERALCLIKEERKYKARVKAAARAFEEERYEDARQLLEDRISENHTDSDVLFLLGRIHLEMGENEKAIEDFLMALDLNPLMAEARFLLGVLYMNVGKVDESLTQLGKAVYADDTFAIAYFYRGRIFETHSDFQRAVKDYETAMNILHYRSPDEPVLFVKGVTNGLLMELCENNIRSLKGKK